LLREPGGAKGPDHTMPDIPEQKENLPTNQAKGRQKMPPLIKVTLILTAVLIGTALLAFLIYVAVEYNPSAWVTAYINEGTNGYVFAVLMALLPVAGIPISIFLVLVAMIFGLTGGIALTGALMFFHLAATYYLTHTLFRPLVMRLLSRYHVGVLKLPERGARRLAFIFMLFPGLPYSIKNYLLALSGLSFWEYVIIGWTAQFSLSIPFVLLGRAVIKMDPLILGIALALVILAIIGQNFLRRRYKKPY